MEVNFPRGNRVAGSACEHHRQSRLTRTVRAHYQKRAIVELDNKLASRSVNEGFSGGEKKRNEIFQRAVLEPRLSILDETDSGLDIDALRIVAGGVNTHTVEVKSVIGRHHVVDRRLLITFVAEYGQAPAFKRSKGTL